MNYRSQVYISSTYIDLVTERETAVGAILTANCIPVGMEMFPANDNNDIAVWETIQSLIKKSDIFLLVIGSRYGTLTKDEHGSDLSCVEREYNYANSLGKPILVFCQEPTGSADMRLVRFIERLKSKHIISFVRTDRLKMEIIKSLQSITLKAPMRIMISWAGALSRDVGIMLRELLSVTSQAADVFLSTEDIKVGASWQQALADIIASCQIAIVCITAENINSPWLMYEFGALSQRSNDNESLRGIVPLLIDTDVKALHSSPFLQYQACDLSKDAIYKLVFQINQQLQSPLPSSKLNELFNTIWPTFESKIRSRLTERSESLENDNVDKFNELRQGAKHLLEKMDKLGR